MKMRSKTGKDVYIASLMGTSIVIGNEYRFIPIEFRRDALMMTDQLEIEGIDTSELVKQEQTAHDPVQYLVKVILDMIREGDTETNNFTNAGLPNLNIVRSKAGYNVSKDEMLVAWEIAQRENEAKTSQ